RGSQSRSKRERSPPAENAEPAPVRMTARTAASPAAASNASRSAAAISASIAFRLSGRSSVTVRTPSSPSARLTGAGSTRTGSGSPGTPPARLAAAAPTRRAARRGASRTTGSSPAQAALELVPSVPGQVVGLERDAVGLEHGGDVGQVGGAQLGRVHG